MISNLMYKFCSEKSVYWEKTGADEYGMPVYGSPMEVECRWEEGNTEVTDAQGQVVVSTATVYVLDEMKVGGLLWKGELDNLNSDQKSNPRSVADVGEIVSKKSVKSLYFDGEVKKVYVR